MKVLFVCAANVGRSQMAEAVYNLLTDSKDASSAAGKQKVIEKYRNRAHPWITQVMAEVNINISARPVRVLTAKMIKAADRIILLCDPNDCTLRKSLINNPKVVSMPLEDPVVPGSDEAAQIEKFRATRDLIWWKIELMLAGQIG